MTQRFDNRDALRNGTALRQIVSQKRESRPAPDQALPTTFEAVTRQMVVDVHGELKALRARIDSLFSVVVGAIVLDLLLRLAGWR